MNEAILIWLYLAGSKIVTAWWISFSLYIAVLAAIGLVLFTSSTDQFGRVEEKRARWINYQDFIKRQPFKSLALICFLALFYPSQNDIKYIIGGALVWNGAQAASEIEGVQKLPENLVGAMNHFLEQVQEK